MKDDDFKLFRGFEDEQPYPESQTFVRVAFATEKKFYKIITIIKLKIFYFTVKQIYS